MEFIKVSTNYQVTKATETHKLEGSCNVVDDKIEYFNATIYTVDGVYIGTANYNESASNYNYSVSLEYKATVIELVDEAIAGIKEELGK